MVDLSGKGDGGWFEWIRRREVEKYVESSQHVWRVRWAFHGDFPL